MKFDTNNMEHYSMVAKYLAGEMGASEAKRFEEVVDEHPENKIFFNQMKKDWKTVEKGLKKPRVDVDEAWTNLINRLNSDNLIESKVTGRVRQMNWMSWAASLVALIAIGGILFLSLGRQSENLLLVETNSEIGSFVQTLADGSVVYLGASTQMQYRKDFGEKDRHVSLNGEAFFEIAHNLEKPFTIEVFDKVVEVLGTSFNLKSTSKEHFELQVKTGTVRIKALNDAAFSVIVSAGEMATLLDNQIVKTSIQSNSFESWKSHKMRFKDESIAKIIEVINRNYNSSIIVESEIIGSKRITVTFHNSDLNSIVEVICATLNLEARFENGNIILSQPYDS